MTCPQCGTGDQKTSFCVNCGSRMQMPGKEVAPEPAMASPEPASSSSPAPAAAVAVVAMHPAQSPAAHVVHSPAPAAMEVTRSASARPNAPEVSLGLQHSETAVLDAAATLYAAYISSNQVTAANEADLMDKAVRTAMQLAVLTDRLVRSDDEEW